MFNLCFASTEPRTITKQMMFKKLLDDMYILSSVKIEGYQLRFKSLVYEMLFQLYHNFSIPAPTSSRQLSVKNRKLLTTIINYSYEHYTENISIEKIASICHLQPQYFCRFFKKSIGQTYFDFLCNIRLYYICMELLNTDLPIQAIAEKNGFRNYDTFLKYFKDRLKCTPREYRTLDSTDARSRYLNMV